MNTLIDKGNTYFLHNYKQFDLVLSHGEGNYVFDTNGKKYLDFVGGIATNALGYSNTALKEALHEQVDKLLHCSNLYWNEPSIIAAEKLVKLSGLNQVFFCNSGAESIEAAMKLARKAQYQKGHSEKIGFITMKNSFHGRTIAAITATGQTKYQEGFGPLFPYIQYGEFNDIDSIKALINNQTCAVIVEPVQGEGGIKPAEKGFMTQLRQLCDATDTFLIFDEVQCGIGRTGTLFAYENYHVKPDILCLAKGLGSGVPIGAIVADKEASKGFEPGDHASTFGANPLVTAAANVVLDTIGNPDFLETIKKKGDYLNQSLQKLVDDFDFVTEVRGLGLIQGIVVTETTDRVKIMVDAMANGLLLVSAGKDVIRFVPPLTIELEEIDECMAILTEVLKGLF